MSDQYANAGQLLSQYIPSIPWQVFDVWALAEGNPGIQAGNPLNIAYSTDPNLTGGAGNPFGEYDMGPGLANTAGFGSNAAGAQATANLLTENQYSGIGAAAQQYQLGRGTLGQILDAIEASPWAGSHYGYSGLNALAAQQFGQGILSQTGSGQVPPTPAPSGPPTPTPGPAPGTPTPGPGGGGNWLTGGLGTVGTTLGDAWGALGHDLGAGASLIPHPSVPSVDPGAIVNSAFADIRSVAARGALIVLIGLVFLLIAGAFLRSFSGGDGSQIPAAAAAA